MQAGTRLTMVALMLGALGDSTAVSAEDALTLADVRCVVVGMPVDLPMATNGQWLSARWDQERAGGERGIRTLEGLLTLTPLAGVRLRPLGHLSGCRPETVLIHGLGTNQAVPQLRGARHDTPKGRSGGNTVR